jgi:hypothetical protein
LQDTHKSNNSTKKKKRAVSSSSIPSTIQQEVHRSLRESAMSPMSSSESSLISFLRSHSPDHHHHHNTQDKQRIYQNETSDFHRHRQNDRFTIPMISSEIEEEAFKVQKLQRMDDDNFRMSYMDEISSSIPVTTSTMLQVPANLSKKTMNPYEFPSVDFKVGIHTQKQQQQPEHQYAGNVQSDQFTYINNSSLRVATSQANPQSQHVDRSVGDEDGIYGKSLFFGSVATTTNPFIDDYHHSPNDLEGGCGNMSIPLACMNPVYPKRQHELNSSTTKANMTNPTTANKSNDDERVFDLLVQFTMEKSTNVASYNRQEEEYSSSICEPIPLQDQKSSRHNNMTN